MIPPGGFKAELYPLRHRIKYAFGLNIMNEAMNTALVPIVRNTSDVIAGTPQSIVVNPHNALYVEDAGCACCEMSIIDKLSLSLRFNMTEHCNPRQETDSAAWSGDGIRSLKFLWRPIFFSFNEKLAAADDDTTTTVEAILGVTSDTTFEDVVPLTTNKLPTTGSSDLLMPFSTVNIAEIYQDYNMSTNAGLEDHVWDEDLFHAALRRYTNKGALKSMVGQTRHVTLTASRPYKNFYIEKFLPSAVRRIMPYSFFAIQVHLPLDSDVSQNFSATTHTDSVAHLGVKIIANYHEWNADHWQGMTGAAPAP